MTASQRRSRLPWHLIGRPHAGHVGHLRCLFVALQTVCRVPLSSAAPNFRWQTLNRSLRLAHLAPSSTTAVLDEMVCFDAKTGVLHESPSFGFGARYNRANGYASQKTDLQLFKCLGRITHDKPVVARQLPPAAAQDLIRNSFSLTLVHQTGSSDTAHADPASHQCFNNPASDLTHSDIPKGMNNGFQLLYEISMAGVVTCQVHQRICRLRQAFNDDRSWVDTNAVPPEAI